MIVVEGSLAFAGIKIFGGVVATNLSELVAAGTITAWSVKIAAKLADAIGGKLQRKKGTEEYVIRTPGGSRVRVPV